MILFIILFSYINVHAYGFKVTQFSF